MSHSPSLPLSLALGLSLLSPSLLAQGIPDADRTPDERRLVAPAQLKLLYGTFDPVTAPPDVPADLQGGLDTNLRIVQFQGQILDSHRQALSDAGAEIFSYLHDNALVVRLDRQEVDQVSALEDVRYVGDYQPAYRLEPFLLTEHVTGQHPWRRYNLIVTDPAEKADLVRSINGIEGVVDNDLDISIRMEVSLNAAQLVQVARMDQVLWIDRYDPPGYDMNNARLQGGALTMVAFGGYEGEGVRGEIYEGVEITHPDFQGPGRNGPIVHRNATPSNHGHCTYGIVFGNGAGNQTATGMLPLGQGIVANHSFVGVSRATILSELVSIHKGMFQTASWGNGRTTLYSSISAEMDDIIFRFDTPITQSQSNAGDRMSRPQAWAKNVISVGGVRHGNNAAASDDNWTGGASIGPAEDGRIKPDIVAYYDQTYTTDRVGIEGYQPGDYNPNFGGTSGATPIVAGHLGLTIEMFAKGGFGNAPKVPGGDVFDNRPHAMTAKALLINTAKQYAFSGPSADLTRVHQGWGFPDLAKMYSMRDTMFIVDEDDPVGQGEVASYVLQVPPGQNELKVTMIYRDPPANPTSSLARINNLDVKLVAPDTTVYYGNNGLLLNNYTTPFGSAEDIDTVENIFVFNPVPGNWVLEVSGTNLNVDAHLATAETDAVFSIVALGATAPTCEATVNINGTSCPDVLGLPLKLSWEGCFSLGETIEVQMTGLSAPGSAQFIALGNDDQNWAGIPLPLDLAIIGSPGCFIFNDQDRLFDVSGALTGGALQLDIPADQPDLIGSTFFWQGLIVTTGGSSLQVFTTNQLETIIGN